jgi:hypothetical protein
MRRRPCRAVASRARNLTWHETRLRNGYTYWSVNNCYPFVLTLSQPSAESYFTLRFGTNRPCRGHRYLEMDQLWEGMCHDLDEGKDILLEKLLTKLKAEPSGG